MKKLNLMATIVLFFIVSLATCLSASAREIKIALDCPPDANKCGSYRWSKTFGDYLESEGLKVTYYQKGTLGDESERLDQVSQDLLEISNSAIAKPGSLDPTILGFRLPFLISDIDHFYRIVNNSDLMEKINAGVTPEHVRVLAVVPLGAFHGFATTNKLIKTPADFKNVRMRALDGAQAKWLELWGANAVIVPWAEIYTSLQTGICDGYMNPPSVPTLFKHTEVIKYFAVTNLAPSLRSIIASEDWYQGLSKKERTIIDTGVNKANESVHEWANKSSEETLQELRDAGVEVYKNSPEEREAFASLIRPNYENIVEPEVAKLFIKLAAEQNENKN